MMLSASQLAFMHGQRVGHLATTDADGRPHVVPVCFVYADGCFWIAIDEKPKRTQRLKRLRNIEANPKVSLVIDRYDEDWSRLAYVLVGGTASVIARGPEHDQAVEALREKYAQYGAMRLEERPVIRIRPERVVSWGELG